MKLEGHIKRQLISTMSYFLKKNLSSGFQIIRLFFQRDQTFYKTADKSTSIHTNQIPLSTNRLKTPPLSPTHVFKTLKLQ